MSVATGPALWAVRFGAGAAEMMDPDRLPAELVCDGEAMWAHFALSDQRSRDWLQRLACLPADARAILLGEDATPRILFDGPWAYGVLPDFARGFDGRIEGAGRLRFAFDDGRLVTARRGPLETVHDVRRKLEAGGMMLATPLEAFLALARRYCELSEDQADEISLELDRIEDNVLSPEADLDGVNLGPTRRDLSRRHREIASLRTALHRASVRHGGHPHPLLARLSGLQQLTEDADHQITALQDRARLVHEELDTRLTGAANRSLHALTVMSVLLMPPTLIVGAFGMNLRGITFGESPHGFLIVCGACVAAVVGVYVALRRMRVLK